MKAIFSLIFGVQSKLSFFTTLFVRGHFVGTDMSGNRYYTGKARKNYTHERRWVVYKNGIPEASQVPPEFHGWLHHQTNIFPETNKASYRQPWQKPHTPNLTGTDLAYRPPGYDPQKGNRNRASGDYDAWMPK